MNDYERTKHEFDIRLLNDARELDLIKQKKVQERGQVAAIFDKDVSLNNREYEII